MSEDIKGYVTKVYPIYINSCSECPNCRTTMDSDMNIWAYYCLALRLAAKKDDVTKCKEDDSINPNCPLEDKVN